MTIHYHGTPISPRSQLLELAGRFFCVSYASPQDVRVCHESGQGILLDNGAFTHWKKGLPGYGEIGDLNGHFRGTILSPVYRKYVDWCREWTAYPTTWAIIPDSINGDAELNQRLVDEWPVNEIGVHQAAPVWHLHESIDRLRSLINGKMKWPRVCIGSSGEYAVVGSDRWRRRMDVVFNRITDHSGRVPCWLHMLRGMSLAGDLYPFASLDSTDVARNHNRGGNIVERVNRWDRVQCPKLFHLKMEQQDLLPSSDSSLSSGSATTGIH